MKRLNLFGLLYCFIFSQLLVVSAQAGTDGFDSNPTNIADPAIRSSVISAQYLNGLNINFQTILESTRVKDENAETARTVSYDYAGQKRKLEAELLKTLNNRQASNLNRGMAAYYLGELHATNASETLAQHISLLLSLKETALYQGLPIVCGLTARDALVKIGPPAIPAVIRNLAESDNFQIRKYSMDVLRGIDSDADIIRLRLQKALLTEPDLTKQHRLQSALKSF